MAKPAAAAEAGQAAAAAVPPDILRALQRWADEHLGGPPKLGSRVAVALSGGADSVALLLAAQFAWPGAVQAIHINHGLQCAAAEFVRSCETLCARLAIPLTVSPLHMHAVPGSSLEAEARRHRYLALANEARRIDASVVLLGHHADDQAETVLLALTRGSGLPGLAAMGQRSLKHGVWFGRPFLTVRGARLRHWLQSRGADFVDDPSNRDQRFTRNRIRHSVLPQLTAHFPSLVNTLGRTARHAAEASALLLTLAQEDLCVVGCPPNLKKLKLLSMARLNNVLRHWLQVEAGSAPSTAQIDELLRQIAACVTRGHSIDIKVSAGRVRLLEGLLHYSNGDSMQLFEA